ncbi:MAG: gliding motility-associated C-terminal domain-containing protein, partial [Bacteroidia bacterium]
SLDPSTGTITLSTSAVGVYTLSYTTFGNCPNTSSITMTINDTVSAATFTYVGSPFCQSNGANPFPTYIPGASAGIYSATPSGLVFAHVNTGEIDLAASAPGTYVVTNTIPTSGACQFVDANYTITINGAPVITAVPNATSFCESNVASLNIALSSSIPGTQFSWTVAQSGLTGGSPGNGASISQTLTSTSSPATAAYTISSDAGGCLGNDTTITITVHPTVSDTTAAIITLANCGTNTGGVAGITVSAGQAPFTFQWKDSTNAVVGNTLDLSNVGPGLYTLTITDGNNCSKDLGPFDINSTPAVMANFTMAPDSGETPLVVNFTNTSQNAVNYVWYFGTGDSSTAVNPSYTYIPLGNFIVCLMANDGNGCWDSVCANVDVYLNSQFIIPNLFTPNGDGKNDEFTLRDISIGLKTLDAEIYNRWGQREYEWHTPNGGWDGRTTSGVLAADGTYYYVINAEGVDGEKYFRKGSFTLIRGK